MLFVLMIACGGARPPSVPGHLPPCPESPNCVSSEARTSDTVHWIEPLRPPPEAHMPNDALTRLRTLVAGMPRSTLTGATPTSFTATFTSRVFRFVDDLELRMAADASVVHVRSASRVGYGDMGVNRARVEALRAAWLASFSVEPAAPVP